MTTHAKLCVVFFFSNISKIWTKFCAYLSRKHSWCASHPLTHSPNPEYPQTVLLWAGASTVSLVAPGGIEGTMGWDSILISQTSSSCSGVVCIFPLVCLERSCHRVTHPDRRPLQSHRPLSNPAFKLSINIYPSSYHSCLCWKDRNLLCCITLIQNESGVFP